MQKIAINEGDAEVIGKRTLENGLVVPAIYSSANKKQEHIRCVKWRSPSNKGKSEVYERCHRKNCKKKRCFCNHSVVTEQLKYGNPKLENCL